MGHGTQRPPFVWVTLAHVTPLVPGALDGAAGGYIWMGALAFDAADFRRRIDTALRAGDLALQSVEMVESAREPEALGAMPDTMTSEVRADLDRGVTQAVWFGKCFLYPSDDE